jgi:hypothetical protein
MGPMMPWGIEHLLVCGKLSGWLARKSTSDERQSHVSKLPLRNTGLPMRQTRSQSQGQSKVNEPGQHSNVGLIRLC